MTNLKQKAQVLMTVVAIATFAAGCSTAGQVDVDRHIEMPEPTSTNDLEFIGGSSATPMTPEELPAASDVAMVVEVVDVHRSHPNTQNREFPAIDVNLGPDQLRGLYPVTEVDVRLIEVLGGMTEALPGDVITITVHGGMIATMLTPEEAIALDVDSSGPADTSPHPDEGEKVDPTHEPDARPDDMVQYTIGLAPSIPLTEGDTVAVFLTSHDSPSFADAEPVRVVRVTHPVAVFREQSGTWQSDVVPSYSAVDIRMLASQIR